LVGVLGINAISNTFSTMSQEDIINMVISGNDSIAYFTNKIFFHFVLIEKALVDGNILMGIFFILIVIAMTIMFLFIARMIYFKGAGGITEAGSKRRRLTNKELGKASRKKNVIYAYTVKELKLVFRSPMCFMNAAMLPLIWPVLFLIPTIGKRKKFRN
jgi:ABC-2 type transport system permease protein